MRLLDLVVLGPDNERRLARLNQQVRDLRVEVRVVLEERLDHGLANHTLLEYRHPRDETHEASEPHELRLIRDLQRGTGGAQGHTATGKLQGARGTLDAVALVLALDGTSQPLDDGLQLSLTRLDVDVALELGGTDLRGERGVRALDFRVQLTIPSNKLGNEELVFERSYLHVVSTHCGPLSP